VGSPSAVRHWALEDLANERERSDSTSSNQMYGSSKVLVGGVVEDVDILVRNNDAVGEGRF
jgi:hypothetical protein